MPPVAARSKGPPVSGQGAKQPAGRIQKPSKSLREVYDDARKEISSSKPNSEVVRMLPDKPGIVLQTPSGSDMLDLRRNYVGDKGLVPVLAVIQRSPQLRRLNFAENGLRNNAIKVMCATLAKHPGVTSIDVSDNYISEGAGRALEQLLKENPRITELNFNNTKIEVDLRLRLKELVSQNMTAAAGTAM